MISRSLRLRHFAAQQKGPARSEAMDIGRVHLPDATLYSTIWQVKADRVQVRGTGGDWVRWVDRWSRPAGRRRFV
jgi:hypothetical protein